MLILLSSKQTGSEAHQASYYCSKQIGCEAYQASHSMGTGCSFTGVKVAGLWGWRHSPPASAEVKLSVDCTSAPPYVLMVCRGTTSPFPPLCTVQGSCVIVLLLVPNFQLVSASFVLPLNIVKLTVPSMTLTFVRIVNLYLSICLSLCFYTNAPQVKLFVLKILRVEVLTVT
jgi:hypothetical protein